MCGIAGVCSLTGVGSQTTLEDCLSALKHRGPDDSGIYSSHCAALGAVRLKVLDLHSGHQPMRSSNGDLVLVFNGEIFNHAELRSELGNLGHSFRTNSDTEVVLRALEQWGPASLRRLRGMFGFAIWNEREKHLLLARDPMGIKPVYYCEFNGKLYFGSELKTIFAHEEVPRHLDLEALNTFLCLNYIPGPATLVQGIRKLLPGHYLEWHSGKTTIHKYKAELPAVDKSLKLEDAKQELESLLRSAIREQMVADVPLGVWASGGLDSSSLVHYASEVSSKRLRSFSVTFRGRSFDESEYIRAIAERYGTDHTEFDLNTSCNLVDAIESLSYYSDEPSADAGALPVWYLSKLSRKEVTVALSGEGADEIFGGYLTYKADLLAHGARMLSRPVLAGLAAAANLLPVSDEKISFEYKLKRFIAGAMMTPGAAHTYWNGTFTEDEKQKFYYFADASPMKDFVSRLGSEAGAEKFLRFDQDYYLPDDILYKADRMSMAHSLEIRPPFLDERIVRFAASLPTNLKVSLFDSKIVLRELMKDKLPQKVLVRKKTGFDIPVHDWFRSTLKDFMLDTINESSVRESQILDWDGIRNVLDSHLQRKANLGYHIWGLLTLMLWMKRWKITLRPSPQQVQAPDFQLA